MKRHLENRLVPLAAAGLLAGCVSQRPDPPPAHLPWAEMGLRVDVWTARSGISGVITAVEGEWVCIQEQGKPLPHVWVHASSIDNLATD